MSTPRFLARTLIAFALASTACDGRPRPDDAGDASAGDAGVQPRIFVSTNDSTNTVGSLAAVTLADLRAERDLAPLAGDAVLAWHRGALVALNFDSAGQNNVTYFNVGAALPEITRSVSMRRDDETGAPNPRGYLALDDRRAYVARNAFASLAIVDRAAGAITGVIDLAPYRAGATLPNPRRIARVGGRAWVSLERWSGVPLDVRAVHGAIAVIDPATDAVVDVDPATAGTQVIELPRSNPVGRLIVRGAEVWVACPGAYQSLEDGALLAVATSAPYAAREVITEREAGGNIDAALPLGDDRVLLRVVAREDGVGGMIASTRLIAFSLATRAAVGSAWLEAPGYRLTEPIVARDGRVYVGQRGSEADSEPEGIWVFTQSGERVTSAPIAVGLRPYELSEPETE